jgi:hypothetical protein
MMDRAELGPQVLAAEQRDQRGGTNRRKHLEKFYRKLLQVLIYSDFK